MEFCSSFLGCQISSDVPCVDGYEISNLISTKNAGFIGESFVRPPANIRLEFPLPIDIAYVQLETQMGERKVTSFKFSSISNIPNEVEKKKSEDHVDGSRIFNSSFLTTRDNKNGLFSKFTSQQHGSDDFFLGRWFSVSKNKVFLKNYHYKHWLSIPLCSEDEIKSSCYTGALRNSDRKALNSVQSLILTISCVSPTGPPILKSIKVWGQPSLSSSPSQRNKIVCLWHKKNKQAKLLSVIYGSNNPPVKEEQKTDVKQSLPESPVVPEEFLDPLTCDIMRLPVLLPSGNSIDSSSLDKFVGHEATWGRPASDPFTGVPFKENYKPEPNVYLKVRIDRFLLLEKDLTEPLLKGRGHVVSDSPELCSDTNEILQVKKRRHLGIENSEKKIVTIHSLKRSESLDGASCSKYSSDQIVSYPKKLRPSFDTCENSLAASSSSSTKEKKSQPKEAQKSGEIKSSNDHSGHSLIQTLGSAISSASMRRRSKISRVQVKGNTPCERNLIVDGKPSASAVIQLSKSLDVPKDNYSLTSISSNALNCFCGSVSSVFYSMDCSHHICSNCVRLEMKIPPFDVIKCKECHQVSSKNNLHRAHPKSAFAL